MVVAIKRPIRQVNGYLAIGVEGFASVPCAAAFPENFPSGNLEFRLAEAVPPRQLEFFNLEDVLTPVELASPRATRKLQSIRQPVRDAADRRSPET